MNNQKRHLPRKFYTLIIFLVAGILLSTNGYGFVNSSSLIKNWFWEYKHIYLSEDEYSPSFPVMSIYADKVVWGGESADILYALTSGSADPNSFLNGIYRSNDFGNTWSYLPIGPKIEELILKVHPQNPNILLAGVYNVYGLGGIYLSTDGGEHWDGKILGKIVYDIEVDQINPNKIYASTCCLGEVYQSIDYGETWEKNSRCNYERS